MCSFPCILQEYEELNIENILHDVENIMEVFNSFKRKVKIYFSLKFYNIFIWSFIYTA